MTESFCVEVILALPEICHRHRVYGDEAATVGQAVAASGLDRLCHDVTGAWPSAYGIHGRRVGRDHAPGHGARIEVLRALAVDPKAARRRASGRVIRVADEHRVAHQTFGGSLTRAHQRLRIRQSAA